MNATKWCSPRLLMGVLLTILFGGCGTPTPPPSPTTPPPTPIPGTANSDLSNDASPPDSDLTLIIAAISATSGKVEFHVSSNTSLPPVTPSRSYVLALNLIGSMSESDPLLCQGNNYAEPASAAEAYIELTRTSAGDFANLVTTSVPGSITTPLNIAGAGSDVLTVTGFTATDISPALVPGTVIDAVACSGYGANAFGQILLSDRAPNAGSQPLVIQP